MIQTDSNSLLLNNTSHQNKSNSNQKAENEDSSYNTISLNSMGQENEIGTNQQQQQKTRTTKKPRKQIPNKKVVAPLTNQIQASQHSPKQSLL